MKEKVAIEINTRLDNCSSLIELIKVFADICERHNIPYDKKFEESLNAQGIYGIESETREKENLLKAKKVLKEILEGKLGL